MFDKSMIDDFLKYLGDYYGTGKPYKASAVTQGNTVKIPLFQDEAQSVPDEDAYGMGDMEGMASELNGMFPGPYDPMRMN